MSTDKAARRARFEGAWKVIKQELVDYITGEGMPKDAIEWYERVRENFTGQQNLAHPDGRTSTTTSPAAS